MSQVTKRALAASLIKLLSQKPLDKVTVKDIIEDCGVNRQTFYYHFKDIYDLVANYNLKLWWVAYALKIHDSNFTRMLRKPISEEKKARKL